MPAPNFIPELNPAQIESLIERLAANNISVTDRDLIMRLLRLEIQLLRLLAEKNISIAKLKCLILGPRSDKVKTSSIEQQQSAAEQPHNHSTKDSVAESLKPCAELKRKKGHGRHSAAKYIVTETVQCKDPLLSAGDDCPNKGWGGHLYDTNFPQIFIRLQGQLLIDATRFEQPVWRCSACQQRFDAPLPPGISPIKYDETADVAIALSRYGMGLPMFRLEKLQSLLGIPLPSSTQFERIVVVADAALPIYLEMQRQAAQGEVIYADDTGVRILTFMQEHKHLPKGERRAMQTTAIGTKVGKHEVALYFSGRKHAGENLAELAKLVAIMRNNRAVRANPAFWLPWNYQQQARAA